MDQSGPGSSDLARFALKVYAGDGVPPACLVLQARAGVDVNLLLFAAYAGAARGAAVDATALAAAQAAVGAWHMEVVKALRAVRQRLKAGPPPGPTPLTEALRDKLKKVEIESELIELDTLSAFASGLPVAEGAPQALAAAAMAGVVAHAAGRAPEPAEEAAIGLIARQATAVAAKS
ncbi:TIGR02444 family protein [Xanthobacter sp. KR7-225]|uniref:TIGR02444 family protein n=1 Tax=Xanthobacter sp. KR7-225 TaxID=3156613 RepID=UPI0032B590DC